MASSVEILLTATDKASQQITKVNTSLQTLGKTGATASQGLASAGKATSGMGTSLLSMGKALLGPIAAFGSLTGAVTGVIAVVKSSINDWVAYNEEMRKLSAATGTGVEDLSRLMQAADDMGVSMDAMRTAMIYASKNGIQPTVANIAKLSDRLLGITDTTERAAEMQKIFGRGFGEVAGFVLQGSDAIYNATEAINENLVATEDSVQASRDYAAAMDNLGDSFTGVKNSIAQSLLPALTDMMDTLNDTNAVEKSMDGFLRFAEVMYKINIPIQIFSELMGFDVDHAFDKVLGRVYEGTSRFDQMAEAVKGVVVAEEGLVEGTDNATESINIAEVSTRKYNDSMLLTMASTELNTDEQLALQEALGMVDETTLWAARRMQSLNERLAAGTLTAAQYGRAVQGLQKNIDNLKGKDIYINLFMQQKGIQIDLAQPGTEGSAGAPKTPRPKAPKPKEIVKPQKAMGGTAVGGSSYLIGERGPELFTPSGTGFIAPNNVINNSYNLTINSNAAREPLLSDFALLQVLNG